MNHVSKYNCLIMYCNLSIDCDVLMRYNKILSILTFFSVLFRALKGKHEFYKPIHNDYCRSYECWEVIFHEKINRRKRF